MSTRKIIDPKQNGEKVWLKSHAQATFMSDGSTVEDAINSIEIPSLDDYVTETELNDKGFLTEHQDISHLASKDDVYDSISNIDFYTIKDNPVLNTEDGKLLFVDESGNIGLQLENDRLYVSDVVAGDHILSNKADIDDIPSLNGYAKLTDIPSLDGYAKAEDIPSVDGLVKSEDLPNFDEFAKTEDIPSVDGLVKTEDLPNFDEFAKTEDIPSLDDYASKEWVNNRNYATEYDLKTIDYSSINNIPTLEDETGELNIADESGNIGMKVASEAVYAKDFVAGEHKLSEKVDIANVSTINGQSLINGGDIVIGGGSMDTSNLATKDELSQKQDVISDLETIRQGAAKGATALQSYTEQYKGTVTGVKINGTTKSQSNGIVDLGTVITAHQTLKTINGESIVGSGNIEISGGDIDTSKLVQYDDVFGVKANHIYSKDYPGVELYIDRYGFGYIDAISASNTKYINFTYAGDGTKFLSDDGTYKTISGGSSSSGSGAYAEVNHGTNDTTFTLTPNTFHVWDDVSNLTLTLGGEMSGIANEYLFQFTSGATATTLTLPGDIKWANDAPPTIEPNMIYQVSILKGLASVLEFSNEASSVPIVFYVNDTPYDAMSNMTWGEWVNSEYNTNDEFFLDGNEVNYWLNKAEEDYIYVYSRTLGAVTKSDIIVPEHSYFAD